jgi:hypothetical protein
MKLFEMIEQLVLGCGTASIWDGLKAVPYD